MTRNKRALVEKAAGVVSPASLKLVGNIAHDIQDHSLSGAGDKLPREYASMGGKKTITRASAKTTADQDVVKSNDKRFPPSRYINERIANMYPVRRATIRQISDGKYEEFEDHQLMSFERKEKYRRTRKKDRKQQKAEHKEIRRKKREACVHKGGENSDVTH